MTFEFLEPPLDQIGVDVGRFLPIGGPCDRAGVIYRRGKKMLLEGRGWWKERRRTVREWGSVFSEWWLGTVGEDGGERGSIGFGDWSKVSIRRGFIVERCTNALQVVRGVISERGGIEPSSCLLEKRVGARRGRWWR